MDLLLSTLKTTIASNLAYLRFVEVLESELFVPEEPGFPGVGLIEGGTERRSTPNKKDREILRVGIVPYQSITLDEPGAAIMGSTHLGDQGKGLLKIGGELKTLLNDNFLGLTFYWAHLDRDQPARPLEGQNGVIQYKRYDYSYARFV